MLVEPIGRGIINGRDVRFFRTPLTDGKPDMPWHATDDLAAALGIPRHLRRVLHQKFRQHWKAAASTVATKDGIVTVAPHFVAQGWIDTMMDLGQAPKSAYAEYAQSGTAASQVLTQGLPPDALVDFLMRAVDRWTGIKMV